MGFLCFLLVSMWVFADMGSVLTEHLRAKYGAAGKECVEADVADLRKLQTWLYDLADPQFTAVYAESQDERRKRHDSIETLTVHGPAVFSEMVFAQGMFTKAPLRFGCVARVRSAHGLSALPLAACAFRVYEKYRSLSNW